MKHVSALVGDMLMEPSRLQPCLPSPLVFLCFSGELLLETSKFLRPPGKLLGVEIDGTLTLPPGFSRGEYQGTIDKAICDDLAVLFF